jgi:hypothetical protein
VRRASIVFGQFAVSICNFLLVLSAIASQSPASFFSISLLWIAFAVIQNALRVIVGEQLLVGGVETSPRGVVGVTWTAALLGSGALASIVAMLLFFSQDAISLASFAAALAAFLFYDQVRYAALALGRRRQLLGSDILALLAVSVHYMLVVTSGIGHPWWLAPIFVAVALIAGGPGRPSFASFLRETGRSDHYAVHVTIQTVAVTGASQMLAAVAMPFVSPNGFATVRAVQAGLGPVTTPATALAPLWVQLMSSRRHDVAWASRFYPAYVGVAGLLVGLCGAGAFVLGPTLLDALTAQSPGYDFDPLIVALVAMSLMVVYVGLPGGVHLRVLRAGREILVAQLVALVAGAMCIALLSAVYGELGLAMGTLLHACASVAAGYVLLFRVLASGRLRDG